MQVNFDAKVKASAVDTGAMSLVLIAHVVQTIAIMGMMSPRWSFVWGLGWIFIYGRLAPFFGSRWIYIPVWDRDNLIVLYTSRQ